MILREYEEKDIEQMIGIWNEVVEERIAFPQEKCGSRDKTILMVTDFLIKDIGY